MVQSYNRRGFHRVNFERGIPSTIELVTSAFQQKPSFNEEIGIFTIDVSASGLRFVHKIEFPINYIAIYKIKMTLNNQDLVFFGKIIRKKKLPLQFYEYGVMFDFNYLEQKNLYGKKG